MNKKGLLFLVAFILGLTGCAGPTVYRIDTASPPAMTQREAMEAMELSLSMMDKHPNVDQISVTINEIQITPPQRGNVGGAGGVGRAGAVTPLRWRFPSTWGFM